MSQTLISVLSDDVLLVIFLKLEDDPRNWARLACVCRKFLSLVSNVCCKNKCSKSIPSIVSDLLSSSSGHHSDPPGGWLALHKLSICCPGLLHAGVLLENSDFGLERELGPDERYTQRAKLGDHSWPSRSSSSSSSPCSSSLNRQNCNLVTPPIEHSDSCWSLFDDLYFDTLYDVSEASSLNDHGSGIGEIVQLGQDFSSVVSGKRRKKGGSFRAHLASGVWNLSREQGKKLLASRFRADCLYISDWPGCVHTEEKRKYMLFRGIFKNFKRSQVWRTINDGNRSKISLSCAFCNCKETWDLHSAFCLRRVFGYHDDGEPVVRAYVCENGHVSGAWTDRPMFN